MMILKRKLLRYHYIWLISGMFYCYIVVHWVCSTRKSTIFYYLQSNKINEKLHSDYLKWGIRLFCVEFPKYLCIDGVTYEHSNKNYFISANVNMIMYWNSAKRYSITVKGWIIWIYHNIFLIEWAYCSI